jgi:undecaprenyl diphosphate synthase
VENKLFTRIPNHIGIIPDGNRRWAESKNYEKQQGYTHGIMPGFEIYELMLELGVKEATFYGFTMDNTKRAKVQTQAFVKACVDAVEILANRDANLLVIGNEDSTVFPKELLKYVNKRVLFGQGLMNINFLVNYDWQWDLSHAYHLDNNEKKKIDLYSSIASSDISRVDLIIRWGGRRRLSGFLPVQSVYSDFYVVDDYWPDFKKEQFYEALKWYQTSDATLGG